MTAAAADVKAYQCDGSFVQKEGAKEGRKRRRVESDAKKGREQASGWTDRSATPRKIDRCEAEIHCL